MTIEYQNFDKDNLFQRSGSAVLGGRTHKLDVYRMWDNIFPNQATILQFSFNGTGTLICKWNVKLKQQDDASI